MKIMMKRLSLKMLRLYIGLNKKTVLKTIKPFRDKAPVAEPRVVESDLQEQLSMKAIKSEERKLAHVALKNKLAPPRKVCRKCWGEGEDKHGETCKVCIGEGFVDVEPDMRAVELVLKPEFPKTNVNLSLNVNDMTPDQLIDMLDNLKPIK